MVSINFDGMNDKVPNRLVFNPLASPKRKRFTYIVFSIFLFVELAFLWPIYPLVSGIYPFVFGLPLSFFWAILMILIAFATLVTYYRFDIKEDD